MWRHLPTALRHPSAPGAGGARSVTTHAAGSGRRRKISVSRRIETDDPADRDGDCQNRAANETRRAGSSAVPIMEIEPGIATRGENGRENSGIRGDSLSRFPRHSGSWTAIHRSVEEHADVALLVGLGRVGDVATLPPTNPAPIPRSCGTGSTGPASAVWRLRAYPAIGATRAEYAAVRSAAAPNANRQCRAGAG